MILLSPVPAVHILQTVSSWPQELRDCSESQVLGVPPGVAEADVRRRFRQMAPRVHPDKCCLPRAEDAFKLLNTAVTRLLLRANECAHLHPAQPCVKIRRCWHKVLFELPANLERAMQSFAWVFYLGPS